jgi:beta-phosphoglucomutase
MNARLASKSHNQADNEMLKACLFDLDGVIIDTAKYHYIAWCEIAKELGFSFTEKDNEKLKGVSRMRSLDILLEIGGIFLDDKAKSLLAQRKNALYLNRVLQMRPDETLPGVREFLADCRRCGLRIGLASASRNATTILNHLKIASLFDVIVDGNKATKTKPDPEAFLIGARELGVPPRTCVVFEDAEAGIDAAIAAGMFSVGIGDPGVLGKADFVASGLKGLSVKALIVKLEHRSNRGAPAYPNTQP